jgi:hypothetical protein
MSKQKDIELHQQAFQLFIQGLTLPEIATTLGVSPNTLKYWKSKNCQCVCGYHDWIDFKKKMQVQVPQSVIDATSGALVPEMNARRMVKKLESICAAELNRPDGLRPKTWKELVETFKLIVDLRKVYNLPNDDDEEDEEDGVTFTRTQTVEEKVHFHSAIDDFVKQTSARKEKTGNVVELLVDQSRDDMTR